MFQAVDLRRVINTLGHFQREIGVVGMKGLFPSPLHPPHECYGCFEKENVIVGHYHQKNKYSKNSHREIPLGTKDNLLRLSERRCIGPDDNSNPRNIKSHSFSFTKRNMGHFVTHKCLNCIPPPDVATV
mmetsp:Transcript_11829/g.17630  ORF Transcript_11829/g.17630 Transcript_11829/m.17630 type:complete len:129 (-) Transcript_11829:490-876(-)